MTTFNPNYSVDNTYSVDTIYDKNKQIIVRKEYLNGKIDKITTYYKGCRHSIDDKPSVIEYSSDGSVFKESWHYEGALHRELNKPAFICYHNGKIMIRDFLIYGKYHRTDGPAHEVRTNFNQRINNTPSETIEIDVSRSWCALNDNIIDAVLKRIVMNEGMDYYYTLSSYTILYKTVFLLKRIIKRYKQRKRLQLYNTLSNITIKENKGLYLVGSDILKIIPSYIY